MKRVCSRQFMAGCGRVGMAIALTGQLLLSFMLAAEANPLTEWGQIWQQLLIGQGPRGSGPWGGRGAFCDIVGFAAFPTEQSTGIVWSDRPIFVWQGNLEWVEIRSTDGRQVIQHLDLLRVRPNESINPLILAIDLEQPLQPGTTYRIVLQAPRVETFLPVQFQVMAAPERDRITADLQALAEQGGSAEAIAQRQANYFADRELWADYWQTLLSVEQPSASLQAIIEDARQSVCGAASASGDGLNASLDPAYRP